MNSAFKNKLKYINWKQESKVITLTKDSFNAKLVEVRKTRKLASHKTKRAEFYNEDTYTITTNGYWNHLYLKEHGKYIRYISHQLDDTINESCINGTFVYTGQKAQSIISKLFKDKFGITERIAFGYCDRATINKCIPKNLHYTNESYLNKNLQHISKADYSSNYPSNLIGDLPDWHDHIEAKGTLKPTKEYPFAFYIKSGHIAEYGRFDSHTWTTEPLGLYMLDYKKLSLINPEEDTTILCKKSVYHFDEVVNQLYEAKENNESIEDLSAKEVLNSFIGRMHRKNLNIKDYRLDHVAAIVLGRANQNMLNLYKRLTRIGIPVIQIIVDGIIYKSKKAIGTNIKSLGALMQECTDCDFRTRGHNQYIFMKDNHLVNECHAGFNDNLKTDNLEDINLWRKI